MAGAMEYNKAPISVREGKLFIDGVEVGDGYSVNIKFTPEVSKNRFLGDRTSSSRWIGGDYTGTMTRGRSNAFLKDAIASWRETGKTPEFTITGIATDKGSDYYAETGKEDTVTAVGCVLSGDFSLLDLDTNGDVLKDTINFNCFDVITG